MHFKNFQKNLDLNDDLKDKVFLKQLFISDNKKPQKFGQVGILKNQITNIKIIWGL